VGLYIVQVAPGFQPEAVAKAIDEKFANSYAETLTETETAFVQGFVSMSGTIILVLDVISFVVIGVMLLVLANTMLMSAAEKIREHSVLKALGFGRRHLIFLILGESLLLSLAGYVLLCLAATPVFTLPPRMIIGDLTNFFPIWRLKPSLPFITLAASLLVAFLASLFPVRDILRLKVVDGLRRIV